MSVAPSFVWAYLVLPYCAALGLALPLCVAAHQGTPRSWREKTQMATLACAAGLLVNYALGVLFADLHIAIMGGSLIAVASLSWFAVRRAWSLSSLFGMGWARGVLGTGLLLVFSGPIFFEPLWAWDARSIWFFHAKKIYFDGGLDIGNGWANPAYAFSHVDYPKLLPLLAAEISQVWGLWNEYIPKTSLLVLLAPVVLGLLSVTRSLNLSLLFLSAVLLLGGDGLIWNGYVDAYLALYASLSLIFMAKWLEQRSPLHLVSGITFLGVALNLKNEGTLLAACVVMALLIFGLLASRAKRPARWPKLAACVWLALLLPLVGYAVWSLTKLYWVLPNDLHLGADALHRAWQRLDQGGVAIVGYALLVRDDTGFAVAILLLAAVLARRLTTPCSAAFWFPAAVVTLYLLGLFLIYLATPHDLHWHLSTSANRTILVVIAGYFASAFLALDAIESPGAASDQELDNSGRKA